MPPTPLRLPAVAPVEDAEYFGPAMAKLSPQQRAWVLAFIKTGPAQNGTAACYAAGYGQDSPTEEQRNQACRTSGARLKRDPRILAAIKEVSEDAFKLAAYEATATQLEIMRDSSAKASDRLKATEAILARSGMQIVQKTEHDHVVRRAPEDEAALVKRIAQMATGLGMDPTKLLGQYGVVIDAEYEVVKTPLTALPEPVPSAAGLEDLL